MAVTCLIAKKYTLLGGLEPPAFRLTAERANQLRHKSTLRCFIVDKVKGVDSVERKEKKKGFGSTSTNFIDRCLKPEETSEEKIIVHSKRQTHKK